MTRRPIGSILLVCLFATILHASAAGAQNVTPECTTPTQTNCIDKSSFKVDNVAAKDNIKATLELAAGVYTLLLSNTDGDPMDQTELDIGPNPVNITNKVTIKFRVTNVSERNPRLAVSTGLIESFSVDPNTDSSLPHVVTFTANPRSSSWGRTDGDEPNDGCVPGACENTADVDYKSMLLAAFDPMNSPPGAPPEFTNFANKYSGGFTATNAQYFDPIPQYTAATKAVNFFIGAPHLKKTTVPNTGFVRVFIPEAFITDPTLWNIAGGSKALDDGTAATDVTVGGNAASFEIDQVFSVGGVATGALIKVGETKPFDFSVPQVVIKPAAVNQAPTITAIANQTINEDSATAALVFTVGDTETAPGSLVVTPTSSNLSLVAASGLVLGGSGASRTLTVTPLANQNGTATITATVSDATASTSTSFTLTVNAVNDPPTISTLSNQDGIAGRIVGPLTVTINDIDSTPTLSAATTNNAVVTDSAITLGGTGSARTFTAQTGNAAGSTIITLTVSDGSASASSQFVISSTHSAPVGLTATVAGSLVTLSWSAPATGGAVSNYRVRLGRSAGEIATSIDSGSSTSLALNTLSPGVWFARVQALSAIGASPVSNEVSFTVTNLPSAPRNFSALVSGLSVTFSWEAPISGPVTGYVVEVGTASGLTDVSSAQLGLVTTLSVQSVAGTYFARVKAVNSNGQSVASNEVSFTTAPGAGTPGAPQNLQVSVSGNTILIAWNPPATGGLATGYLLEAGSASGQSNLGVFALTLTSLSTSGVPNGTFFIRVRGTNASGVGPASTEVSFTIGPLVPPGSPSGLTATVSGSTIALTWLAPTTGGAPASYAIVVGSAPGLSNLGIFAVGLTTTFGASAIPPGTYYVRIVATNAAGASGPSNEVIVIVP